MWKNKDTGRNPQSEFKMRLMTMPRMEMMILLGFMSFGGLRREVGEVLGQKDKFGLYQSLTCHGVTTFYGIAKSSFMTKISRVKDSGYYSVPYKI